MINSARLLILFTFCLFISCVFLINKREEFIDLNQLNSSIDYLNSLCKNTNKNYSTNVSKIPDT
jgi:hypothetical protein